jgi:phospholipid/cholesterol/gamma-HCH transport system permease protein
MAAGAMPASVATIERQGRSAVVHLHGDVVAAVAPRLYGQLRAICRRRDVSKVIVDFSKAGRVDSSGIAVISMVGRQLERSGKKFELDDLHPNHKAAFELVPTDHVAPEPIETPGVLERMGDATLASVSSTRELVRLIIETGRQALAVITRKKRLPAGSLAMQVATMGVDGIFIVGLLSFLIGMTMGFQGAVQLQRFGADVFVADMIGVSVVRELAPLMTAVVLTGRTGAAIAAELGTMRVRSEIDALSTMGINPVRFLVVPRIASISFVGPALTLMGMFIGITGGMFVAKIALDMPLTTFWQRIAERVVLGDYIHGLGKSLVFAWIIGFAGTHLGMRARGDASSVGAATTRTVVASIFFIILVDAIFATISTVMKYS